MEPYLVDNRWLANLSSLLSLDLDYLDLSRALNWLQSLNKNRRIEEKRYTYLHANFIYHVNFAFLHVIDLSENHVNSQAPSRLFELSSLEHLDLSLNEFQNFIPVSIGRF